MSLQNILWGVFRQLIILLLIIVSIPLMAASWLGSEIFSPPRRALQSYHLDRLQHPELYGLKIQKYGCLENQAPCLLVEADKQRGIGRRGKKLREQVLKKGFQLAAYGKARGIIVLLHGRKGRKEDLLPVAERFVAAGFRCVIPDLPAHGDSPISTMSFGSSNFERSLARLAVDDVRQHFDLPNEPTALWGISMGGAFAVSAASESPDFWDALVVVNSFGEIDQVLDKNTPKKWHAFSSTIHFFLNASQLIKGQPITVSMTPQKWVKSVKAETLIIHAEKDGLIPISQARELYNRIGRSHRHWLSVPKAGHANVLTTAMPLYAEISGFLIQSLERQQLAGKR